ncbi:MAG: flavin reductase family protein [Asgard group archaeon]|nr:flavin reductase family protein [Asgard group archaeon]
MKKKESGPQGGYLVPNLITLVTAFDNEGKPNAYALCWIMNIGHKPQKIALITREHRYTYTLFKEKGCFGLNIPGPKIINEVDFCGRNSGKDVDKFAATKLNVFKGTKLDVPLIEECHINFECKVIDVQTIEETMIMILAEVVNSHYSEELFNEDGKLDESKIPMIVYGYNHYWGVSKKIGTVGMSKDNKF